MSSSLVKELDTKIIPGILTTSARALAQHYGDSIVELKARGGRMGKNKRWLDESYGVYMQEPGMATLLWEYRQKRDKSGEILNPLEEGLEQVFQYVDDELPAYEDEKGDSHPAALTVDKMVIEVTDEDLMEHTTASTPTFEITFEADKVEKGARQATKSKAANKGVYKQRFKMMNLNLHRMVELSNRLSDEKTQEIVSWNGPGHISPRCPRLVAATLCEKYIPDEFLGLKVFEVTEEENLEMVALIESSEQATAAIRGEA